MVLDRLISSTSKSREALLRIRALDVFGFPSGDVEGREQRRLLPSLAAAAAAEVHRPELTESAVAVGLAYSDEAPEAELQSVALSTEVLASQREFARLTQLAPRFGRLSDAFREERPYLSLVLLAVSSVLAGGTGYAKARLTSGLGLSGETEVEIPVVDATSEQIADLALANALRLWLETGAVEPFAEARDYSLSQQVPSTYALSRAILSYAIATRDNATPALLLSATPEFGVSPLSRYVASPPHSVLFSSQRDAVEAGLFDDASLVLATPTSSGKTFLAELRIALELQRHAGRVVYLAPYRLLARQVERAMGEGLAPLGWSAKDFGGQFDTTLSQQMQSGDLPRVGVMTPERLDGLLRLADSTRNGSEAASQFLREVTLFVLDEAQLVGRHDRGPRVDLLLSRIRRRFPNAKHLALSGVIAGADRLGRWLTDRDAVTSTRRPTGTVELLWESDGGLFLRTAQGPRRLIDIPRSAKPIDATVAMLERIREDLAPTLVVESRKDWAEDVVRRLHATDPKAGDRWRARLRTDDRERLDEVADQAQAAFGADSELSVLIRAGLAFHHAGLPSPLLRGIELLAQRRALRVLAATTTVAEGAHLPFRVVLIPHLNFESGTGRLERDLYLNIVGRVGRANVATEGFVVVFGSTAPTLVSLVRHQLWGDAPEPIRGHLTDAFGDTIDGLRTAREIYSQILAWVGDRGNEIEDQARTLAQSTFSYFTASGRDRDLLIRRVQAAFASLESQTLIQAGSPYRLTQLGERARLAGLAPRSCLRLDAALSQPVRQYLLGLIGTSRIAPSVAAAIAQLLLETEEVLEKTLWFRRSTSTAEGSDPVRLLRSLASGERDWPRTESLFQVDLTMISSWISGASYVELGFIPPTFRKPALFSSTDPSGRAADAAEYAGNLAFPSSWAWAAIVAMLGEEGEAIPHWIRGAIEHGVSTEAAVELVSRAEISRAAAIAVSENFATDWPTLEALLRDEITDTELAALGLTRYDRSRLRSLLT